MISILLALQAVSLGAADHAVDAPMAAPRTRPSFADEFSVDRIDTRIWRFDTDRNAQGWANHERQYYANNRRENTRIEDGALVIEARAETLDMRRFPDWGGRPTPPPSW